MPRSGSENFVGMVVSTGVGGGIVLDGRLLDGRLGNAGHIGHVIVEPDGRPCRCGGRGCLEAEASGTAIAAITGRPPQQAGPEMIDRVGTLVGRAIASVVNLLDLPLAVVSGSVALGYGEPFFEAAQAEMDLRCRLDFARGARVVPGGSGGRRSSGRRGTGRAPRRGAGGVNAAVATRRTDDGERWGRDGLVVARAVATHPRLSWAALGALRRMARRGWWRRRLRSCPSRATSYWRFRLVTADGGDGTSEALEAADVVAYLRWCQRSRPRRG